MTAITVASLSKQFGDLAVLDDLSFTVDSGEVFGLLGPNGAGKTTTINILTGGLAPTSGAVDVLSHNPTDDPTGVRECVGILPEKESPPSFLTPREYAAFVADIRGIPTDVAMARASDWTNRLDFTDKLDVLCKDLSRGQQQKVMLMQAFLHEPELVFIDEPLANLDPVMQDIVKEFITAYHEAGNTIVLSTHHLEVAEELCSRVGILHNGTLATEHHPGRDSDRLRDVFKRTVTGDTRDAVHP